MYRHIYNKFKFRVFINRYDSTILLGRCNISPLVHYNTQYSIKRNKELELELLEKQKKQELERQNNIHDIFRDHHYRSNDISKLNVNNTHDIFKEHYNRPNNISDSNNPYMFPFLL